MYDYTLALPGECGLRITHENEPIFKYGRSEMLAGAYLPGVSFDREQKVGFTLQASNGDKPILLHRPVSNGSMILSDQWKGDSSLIDVLNLAYGAARVMWLRQKMYPVHSACIGDDNGYILLAGPSGVGKSSIVHNAITKLGKKLYSGNKTLVSIGKDGHMRAIAGTRTMTASKADDKPMLWALKTDYLGRVATVYDTVHFAPTSTVDIKAIVMPRLNDGAKTNEKLSAVSAQHRLYPLFLDKVNADVVLPGRGVFVGTPPRYSEDRLLNSLEAATSRIPVYTVSGSMDFVTEALSRL